MLPDLLRIVFLLVDIQELQSFNFSIKWAV